MLKKQFTVRKGFMILMTYFLIGGISSWWAFDRLYYKGPKFQAPETAEAILLFKEKCKEFNIEQVCSKGFSNIVRIDVTDGIWYQANFDPDTKAIGLTEFSVFSPLTKISIDRKLLTDKVLFDTTVIHELGHAVLFLDHNDNKLAIMNSYVDSSRLKEYNYKELVNEMFSDFVDSLR
jgi:predicted Zn-dependent protease